MDSEISAIMENAMRMSWYMRGGMNLVDILNLKASDRALINKIIESNLETTKKSQLPFF